MEYSDIVIFKHLKQVFMKTECLLDVDTIEYEYYIIHFLSWNFMDMKQEPLFQK